MNRQQTLNAISNIGFLMIAVAMVIPLVSGPLSEATWYSYLYAAGAVILLVSQLLSPYKGKDIRLKRLYRIQGWSAIFFCVAAFFLFWPGAAMRDWVAFTLAGAAIRCYTSIAIPNRQRRISNGDNK